MASDVASDGPMDVASDGPSELDVSKLSTAVSSDVSKAQSMEDVLKALNDTIAQQQAQINQLQSEKNTVSVKPTPEPEPKAAPFWEATEMSAAGPNPFSQSALALASNNPSCQSNLTRKQRKYRDRANFLDRWRLAWNDIKIKVDDEIEEEGCSIDENVAERIRLIREDTLYKAKVIMVNTISHSNKDLCLAHGTKLTLTCCKVGSDEVNSFHSADMLPPMDRDYDLFSRYHPHDAMENIKGDSLLKDCSDEMEASLYYSPDKWCDEGKFICCSSRKNHISFYAQRQTEPGSPFITLQHHITLPIRMLFQDNTNKAVHHLCKQLEQAVDPSAKGIKLLENIVRENRGGLLMAKVHPSTDKPGLMAVTFLENDPIRAFPSLEQLKKMRKTEYVFRDSVKLYKERLNDKGLADSEFPSYQTNRSCEAKESAVMETVPETVDEMNNDFIPINP